MHPYYTLIGLNSFQLLLILFVHSHYALEMVHCLSSGQGRYIDYFVFHMGLSRMAGVFGYALVVCASYRSSFSYNFEKMHKVLFPHQGAIS